MKVYVDTSAIISAYKPNEISYEASLRVAKLNTITKVCSYMVITEIFSVISRLYRTSQIKVSDSIKKILSKLSMKERVYALINAIILDWGILCPNLGFEVKQMRLKDFALSMPEALLEACMMATVINLKTLDLIHIACAKIINEAAHDLKYFVTLDQDVLNNRNKIKKIIGFQPLTPQELLDLQ
ncbi:MAG: type II toxin-antitoxin system VapC family toxin [Nitrososphaerales archaeon]